MPIQGIVADNALNKDCPKIILNLMDYVCNNPNTKRKRTALVGRNGYFRSQLAQQFNDIAPEIIKKGPEGTKVHTVELAWLPRTCASDLQDCADVDPCAAGSSDPYIRQPLQVTFDCVVAKETFSCSEWEKTCESAEVGQMRRLDRHFSALLESMDIKIAQQIIGAAGGNAAESNTVGEVANIPAVINENGLLNANALHRLNEDFEENEADDCPVIALFGYKNALSKAETIKRIGCCNDKGVDQEALAEEMGMGGFKAKTIEQAATLSGVFTDASCGTVFMHPGSAQLVEYYRYEGCPFNHGESYGRLYTDPVSGEKFDIKVKFDDCDEVYVVTISKHFAVVPAPTEMYQACDDLANVNGIWLYELAKCPEGGCV